MQSLMSLPIFTLPAEQAPLSDRPVMGKYVFRQTYATMCSSLVQMLPIERGYLVNSIFRRDTNHMFLYFLKGTWEIPLPKVRSFVWYLLWSEKPLPQQPDLISMSFDYPHIIPL